MYTVNLLRLTFFQELTDTEMFHECEELMDMLKISCAVVSPIENPDKDTDNRHIHVHWFGDSLNTRSKENAMANFRKKGGKIYPGNKGSNYTTKQVDNIDEVCAVLRYPLKTGINTYFPLRQQWFPSWFDIEKQASLAAAEYEIRLEREAAQKKRDEAYKGVHGADHYKAAVDRHAIQPFKTIDEIMLFLNREMLKSDTLRIRQSDIADMTSKLMQVFGIISEEQFVRMIKEKYFRDI